MINPKHELFLWGPVPGKFFYVSIFVDINLAFTKTFPGKQWPFTYFLMKDGKMLWINEYAALRKNGLAVFKKYMVPESKRQQIYHKWKKIILILEALEKKTKNLSQLSLKELQKLYSDFHKIYFNFWVYGTVPELGNYGSDKFFADKLSQFIKNKEELSKAVEILTAPKKSSFYQQEELDLLAAKDLQKHQQKYFWLKNSYFGVQVLPVSFFAERKKGLDQNLKKKALLRLKEVVQKKKELKSKLKLSNEIMDIAEAISEGIAWQDERKAHIFKVLYYQDLFLQEIARRFSYPKEDLFNAWYWEIKEILQGKNYSEILQERRDGTGVEFYKKYRQLNPEEVSSLWQKYTNKDVPLTERKVSGLVVSKGKEDGTGKESKVIGKIKIVLDPNDADNFQSGRILVAAMTSPEYVFLMKKASAVITDEGGLTCHAAIVSRELGIPCIVGTRVATKVLKDGDLVEVDANNGWIKILKKQLS